MISFLDPDLCAECGNKFPEGQVCDNCRKGNDLMYEETTRQAAVAFLDACSLTPTPDAVDQLADAFLPCLRIMCERGYDPNGESWRNKGWRNQIMEILERSDRLALNVWRRGRKDTNNTLDIINYAAFLHRSDWSNEWGVFGAPGNE